MKMKIKTKTNKNFLFVIKHKLFKTQILITIYYFQSNLMCSVENKFKEWMFCLSRCDGLCECGVIVSNKIKKNDDHSIDSCAQWGVPINWVYWAKQAKAKWSEVKCEICIVSALESNSKWSDQQMKMNINLDKSKWTRNISINRAIHSNWSVNFSRL